MNLPLPRYEPIDHVIGPGKYCLATDVTALEAAHKATVAAALRLHSDHYLRWANTGGPDECTHGYAAGIPCRKCDIGLIIERAAALKLT